MNSEITLKVANSEETPVVLPAFGRKFTVGNIEISRKDRAASGKLCSDVIADKKKINLSYDMIDTGNLNMLKSYYYLHMELEITYDDSNTNTSCVVLMSPFDWSRVLSCGGGLWSGVNLEFEQV